MDQRVFIMYEEHEDRCMHRITDENLSISVELLLLLITAKFLRRLNRRCK